MYMLGNESKHVQKMGLDGLTRNTILTKKCRGFLKTLVYRTWLQQLNNINNNLNNL